MRKVIVILTLTIAMLLTFTACGRSDDAVYTNSNASDLPEQAIHQDDYTEANKQYDKLYNFIA